MTALKRYFSNKQFLISFGGSVLLLLASLVVNFYAGIYATEKASNYVTDIILDNIPVFNVDLVFIYGPLVLWSFVLIIFFNRPQTVPFTVKSIALFVLVRSMFITLTHIGPFPDAATIDYTSDFVKKFTFGGDLFFSAHTGLPFLMALVFNQNRKWRAFFALAAVFFGAIVLMGHLHYSIDVLSAFFITYTIFHIAKYIFKKDHELFNNGLSHSD
ncbi:MAG: hypothetical protein HYT48_00750 [Candidatus Vogelbacteria bacterium]|nr:hypothetical protein [Candidatus Vogelbacteria bacterium]